MLRVALVRTALPLLFVVLTVLLALLRAGPAVNLLVDPEDLLVELEERVVELLDEWLELLLLETFDVVEELLRVELEELILVVVGFLEVAILLFWAKDGVNKDIIPASKIVRKTLFFMSDCAIC